MPKISELVPAGWTIVGTGMPLEETTTIPNPYASNPVPPAGAPTGPTIQQGTGRYYVILQDSEGHQRALYMKAAPIKGGLEVPVTGQPASPGTRPFTGDLRTIDWEQGATIGDVPAGSSAKQPSATNQLDAIDAKGNVVPRGDRSAKQLRDPSTGTTFNLVTDPNGTLHDLGNDVILVKPDGSYTLVATKPKEPSQFNVPGVGLVEYDPSKPEGQRSTVLIKTPDQSAPTTEVRNGVTYQYDRASGQWIKTDLPAQQDVGYTYNDPNSDQIIFYDKQGKEISRTTKPNWKPPVNVQPGTAPAADLVSDVIPTFDPQTGELKFVPNQAQVKASQATSDLAQQLGLKVAAGSMSEKQAQDLITSSINAMNAQTAQTNAQTSQQTATTQAAQAQLDFVSKGAQTGAGVLQQRAQTAQSLIQSVLGLAGQGQHYGGGGGTAGLSGGMMTAPEGVGQLLTQGAAGYSSELLGGQATIDAASRLVQAADPNSSLFSPTSQAAVGVLAQMFDKYHQLTGAPHPAPAAAAAAAQSANSGVVMPQTQPSTPAVVGQTPQQAAGFNAPPAHVAGQNYGAGTAYTGGVAPWNATPGPSIPNFQAPVTSAPAVNINITGSGAGQARVM